MNNNAKSFEAINNGLLMRNAVQLCFAATNIPLVHKGNRAFSFLWLLLRENGRLLCFPKIFIVKTNSVIDW